MTNLITNAAQTNLARKPLWFYYSTGRAGGKQIKIYFCRSVAKFRFFRNKVRKFIAGVS